MRGKDLLECIEQIDDALVEEAMAPNAFPHTGIHRFGGNAAKWGMAAACVVALSVSAAALWSHQHTGNGQMGHADRDTAGYPMAMDAAADDSGTVTGGSMDSGLTAGMAEGQRESADGGSDATHDGATTVRERTLADDGNDIVHDGILQGDALDDSADTSSQDSASDSLSVKESAEVRDMERILTESAKLQDTVISDYHGERDSSVYDYQAPEKGEVLCYHDLNEAMERYTELESAADDASRPVYAYNIVIDVYGDVGTEGSQDVRYGELNWNDTKEGNELLNQEYIRLIDLGYAVQLAEDFRLTGTFTKEEIDTFQASPEYGYVFRFADEY